MLAMYVGIPINAHSCIKNVNTSSEINPEGLTSNCKLIHQNVFYVGIHVNAHSCIKNVNTSSQVTPKSLTSNCKLMMSHIFSWLIADVGTCRQTL